MVDDPRDTKRTDQACSSRGAARSPERPGYRADPDEIDLVEIGASLWRRRKLIIPIFLIFFIGGFVAAFVLPRTYSYSAVINLGSYINPNGDIVAIIPPDSAVTALENALLPRALAKYIRSHHINPKKIKIKVSTPKSGNTVVLSGEGSKQLAGAYTQVETEAAHMLSESTAAQLKVLQDKYKTELGQAQIALQNIEDPDQIKAQKLALQQALSDAETALEDVQQNIQVDKAKQKHLHAGLKLYKEQEKQLNAQLAQMRKASMASTSVNTPAEAMTGLLLSNEVQQTVNLLNTVEEKITVTIPQELAAVEADIENNLKDLKAKKNAVQHAKVKLQNFDAVQERKVRTQKLKVSQIQSQLDNVEFTKLVLPPTQSLVPTGLSRKAIVLLGAFLGLILSLLAAALANYVAAIHKRLEAVGD